MLAAKAASSSLLSFIQVWQAMQPWICCPPSWMNSVSIPSASSSAKTLRIRMAVFPFALGDPLKATTFIEITLNLILTLKIKGYWIQ